MLSLFSDCAYFFCQSIAPFGFFLYQKQRSSSLLVQDATNERKETKK